MVLWGSISISTHRCEAKRKNEMKTTCTQCTDCDTACTASQMQVKYQDKTHNNCEAIIVDLTDFLTTVTGVQTPKEQQSGMDRTRCPHWNKFVKRKKGGRGDVRKEGRNRDTVRSMWFEEHRRVKLCESSRERYGKEACVSCTSLCSARRKQTRACICKPSTWADALMEITAESGGKEGWKSIPGKAQASLAALNFACLV